MKLEDYGKQAFTTLTTNDEYGDLSAKLISQVMGLMGESGEVAEKFKKLIRDKDGKITDQDRAEIVKELGDILWYINAVAMLLGSNLTEVASVNLEKVLSRKDRGLINGNGDNR